MPTVPHLQPSKAWRACSGCWRTLASLRLMCRRVGGVLGRPLPRQPHARLLPAGWATPACACGSLTHAICPQILRCRRHGRQGAGRAAGGQGVERPRANPGGGAQGGAVRRSRLHGGGRQGRRAAEGGEGAARTHGRRLRRAAGEAAARAGGSAGQEAAGGGRQAPAGGRRGMRHPGLASAPGCCRACPPADPSRPLCRYRRSTPSCTACARSPRTRPTAWSAATSARHAQPAPAALRK